MSIISLKSVRYAYRNKYQTVQALEDINCSFEQGVMYAIVGKSGSGKSTMLSLMAGLDLPDEGDVIFQGTSTRTLNLDTFRRNDAAMIYQSFRLFPLMTALENVMYPMELHGVRPRDAKKRAEEYIKSVDLTDVVFNRFPSMLSGGEQQRIAIARALAMDTNIILADEPTGNLDSTTSRNIMALLAQLAHERNYCVVVVTHDIGVLDMMDVTYQMRDGILMKE
ncbi:MAG TPA: ABC transporter ATP-binding protein [Clostridiales bacterium]|nr:ABC transporter ATP-binding protein [Clostridia bacterium]HCS75349.1 ABC transporter ATP-binding protein [Clostridiales bacterium]